DGVAGLLLGAHEQHRSAAVGNGPGELLGLGEQALSLEQVDDVDAAALTEYEAAHLGVPAARLMAEVNAGLQQLRDAYVSHGLLPCMYAIEFRVDGADPEPARESLLRAGPRSTTTRVEDPSGGSQDSSSARASAAARSSG